MKFMCFPKKQRGFRCCDDSGNRERFSTNPIEPVYFVIKRIKVVIFMHIIHEPSDFQPPITHTPADEKLGFWTLTMLVVGNLVGSGAFLMPATLAVFGSLCLCGWAITSIGAIILSLIFSKLSTISPRTGGPHTYVEDAFGKTAGYFTAWSYWVLSWISNAGLVVGAIGYASPLLGVMEPHTIFIAQIVLLAFLSIINLAGMHFAGRFEMILTLCKVIPLIALPLIGIFYIEPSHFIPFNGTTDSVYTALNATAYATLWCFVGLETGTVPGSDVENPKKNIPRSILAGTLIATFIYILGTIAIMGVVPKDQLIGSKAPYAELAGHLFGGSWSISVALLASIACAGALNGWIMVVSRISQGAAEDGLFPAFFSRTTKKGAPLWGTLVSFVCTGLFMALSLSGNLLEQFKFILDFSVCLVLVIYLVCVAAYFVMLRTLTHHHTCWYHYGLGGAGVLFCIWTLTQAPLDMMAASFLIILLGLPMWFFTHKRRKV